MKIALLCPTRERISNITRLVHSLLETTTNTENITLYFGVDDDDPTMETLINFCSSYPFIKIVHIHNEGIFLGLGKIWNIIAKEANEDILAMIGDDMTFDTKNWDREILEEFEKSKDKIILVHAWAGTVPSPCAIAVNSFIHRKYYDTFGYYVREEWKHWYHDTWLHDIFTKLGRRIYRHDILIFHHHPDNPNCKVGSDPIYDRLNRSREGTYNPSDPHKEFRELEHIRLQEVEKLKEFFIND